jgi:F-type H+-transporting ATPase subunit b
VRLQTASCFAIPFSSAQKAEKKFAPTSARVRVLVVLVLCLAGLSLTATAQQPAAPPEQAQQQNQRPPGHQGFARQLTHETREAAGEEKDEKAEFRSSASVRFIARLTGMSTTSAYFACVLFNFAVITVVIIWAARKFLPHVFSNRTSAIQKAMQEAQKASEEARRRLAGIESRLKKLDVEIGMMRDSAEKEAAGEEARIHAAAEEDARKIVESAQQEIEAAAKAARRELKSFAADLAVSLAEKQIRVDLATDHALVTKFAGELGQSSSANGSGKDGR